MTPTIFRAQGFRFFFFLREEPRMHVHVYCGHGEAKFWIEPKIELAQNHSLTAKDIGVAQKLIEEHEDEIRNAWRKHFGSGGDPYLSTWILALIGRERTVTFLQ